MSALDEQRIVNALTLAIANAHKESLALYDYRAEALEKLLNKQGQHIEQICETLKNVQQSSAITGEALRGVELEVSEVRVRVRKVEEGVLALEERERGARRELTEVVDDVKELRSEMAVVQTTCRRRADDRAEGIVSRRFAVAQFIVILVGAIGLAAALIK